MTETRIPGTPRIDSLDVARGFALLAMAVYHFTWDLEFFGYLERGVTATGGLKLFARCIASSFLVLTGVSLFLAHRDGIRWRSWARRFAMVAGAALAISLATYFATPDAFIFFGILHEIALASLLGLAFLRLPWWGTLGIAAAVIAAPQFLRSELFDAAAWWWLGLSADSPRSNDYVPVFPWLGAVLIGIALAKIAVSRGWTMRLADIRAGSWARPFRFAGRHSLAVYLIHQPVLIASLWLFSQLVPPEVEPPEASFSRTCQVSCSEVRDAAYCDRYCACFLEELERDDALDEIFAGKASPAFSARIDEITNQCTLRTNKVAGD